MSLLLPSMDDWEDRTDWGYLARRASTADSRASRDADLQGGRSAVVNDSSRWAFPPVTDPVAETQIVARDGDARRIDRGPVPLPAMILDAEPLELPVPNMLLDGFVTAGRESDAGKRGEGTRILKVEALGMSNPKKMNTASVPRRAVIVAVIVVVAAAISKAWNSISDRMSRDGRDEG